MTLSLDDAWDECGKCGVARGNHGIAHAWEPVKPVPLKVQVGGDHYTRMAIQPMEYSMANKLDALQHTIVKYVSRFRSKNGIEDLKKARHAIDMLIAHEEKNVPV